MMSGLVSCPEMIAREPRRYSVLARSGGWSIVLNNGACTRPFRSRRAAERIARSLRRQADGLSHIQPVRSQPERHH